VSIRCLIPSAIRDRRQQRKPYIPRPSPKSKKKSRNASVDLLTNDQYLSHLLTDQVLFYMHDAGEYKALKSRRSTMMVK